MAKLTAAWNKQAKSTNAGETVKQYCGKYFVMPVPTRWNSLRDSVKRVQEFLAESNDGLKGLFTALKVPHLTENEASFIKEYVAVTDDFADALDLLQGDKISAATEILPGHPKLAH